MRTVSYFWMVWDYWLLLYASIFVMAIEKFLYLLSLGWLLQEYNFRMGSGFQVWKFHVKISLWVEKPSLPRAYGPWEASFLSHELIFGGEEISISETWPIRKSYISEWIDCCFFSRQQKELWCNAGLMPALFMKTEIEAYLTWTDFIIQ